MRAIIFFILIAFTADAQKSIVNAASLKEVGPRRPAYTLDHAMSVFSPAMVSGAAWGVHESIVNHWGEVQSNHPRLRAQWWNPAQSWTNKYNQRNPDLGRNNTPIWFTDAKHLFASGNQVYAIGTGVVWVAGERRPWWHYLLDAGVAFVGYTGGNYLTYNVWRRTRL